MKPNEASQYKRLSEVQHVLARSGMYLGSTINTEREAFIVENGKMVCKTVEYNPALVKMFDEIISNSADESIRSGNVKNIWVTVEDGIISVKDDGGIPVVKHPEYGIYVPELLFGELRSGSNFDDDNRVTAGMNGLGSVLTNIFSKMFKVETSDRKHKFVQVYSENMSEKTEPEIVASKEHGTTITFLPDYERLGCSMTESNLKMIERRCYDIAAVFKNVNVYFNGNKISIKSFDDFSTLFVGNKQRVEESDSNWQVVVSSSLDDDSFRHVSYVNGIDTFNGGSHVNYIADQIVGAVRDHVKKKHKIDVKPNIIRQCLFLFITAKINAPMFTSQTKEQLINDPKTFDNPIKLSQKFIKKVLDSDIVEKVIDWAESEKRKAELAELRKVNKETSKASLKHILKFEDAATKDRSKAILYFTEGDSAAATLKAARKANPNIGVFALRGKVLNVRKVKQSKILDNEEIKNILAVTGLQLGKKVIKSDLYFQQFAIASDADADGAHICSLLINMFGVLWKEVLLNGLVYRLNTPILVAKTGKQTLEFFSIQEYEDWAKDHPKHTVKYYKGLGGWSTSDFERFLTDPKYLAQIVVDEEDLELLDLIFNSSRANDRKEWLVSDEV